MNARRTLVLATVVALAVPMGLAAVAAQPSDPARGPRVELRWSQTFPARQDPGGVAVAPHHSYVLLSPQHAGRGLHIARYDRRGRLMWDHGWVGRHHRAVKSVLGEATAVSVPHRAVFIAGHATCRHQGEASLGPVFVRKYTLGGKLRWSRWIGSCPRRSSDHRAPPLSVAGMDVLGKDVAVAFTRGYSWDCCVHHRKGYVTLFELNGSMAWRTRLHFPLAHVSEVVTEDVAMSSRSITVSGEVMWGTHGADGFLAGLSRSNGATQWRHVTSGATEADNDRYLDLDSVGDAVFATSVLDDAFEGGGARIYIERWSPSGARVWHLRLHTVPQLAALPGERLIWSSPVWHPRGNHYNFGEVRPHGTVAWKASWTLPDHDMPIGYVIDARSHEVFGAADIIHDRRDFLQTWCWRLR